ncbi:MAG: pyridoxamine 5'-phosphate oxidase family protein [Bacteroidales bacterium]
MKAICYESGDKINEIIDQCTYCTVSLNGIDGFPYVFPMNFVRLEGKIYLHSAPHGTHLSLLDQDNRIVLSFVHGNDLVYQHSKVACSHSMRSDSVVIRGSVSFLESIEQKIKVFNELMNCFVPGKEFVYSLPSLQNVKIWIVEPQSITAKGVGLTFDEYKSMQPGRK